MMVNNMIEDIDAITLKKWIDSGKDFTLIDARDSDDFNKGHIPGALSILLSEIDEHSNNIFEKDTTIVVYSNDINCPASGLVSSKLDRLGYGPVYNYDPSYADWIERAYPIVK